ncbi:MAG: STAS/SEC14 domain-containing protein [Chloroflexi bacterium]|nr:STAS/SEC14 domain-containing protein [Chloroflexota bacterium]
MPCTIEPFDDDMHKVTISDPVTREEIKALTDELHELIERREPLFVYVDLRRFDFARSFMNFLEASNGIPMPSSTAHFAASRLAIVGGGPALSMAFGLMGSFGEYAHTFRVFDGEEAALAWLRRERSAS